MLKIKIWLRKHRSLLLIGGGLFLVFVYLRFPVSMFQSNLEENLERLMPNTTVSIGSVSTTLLPGIALKNVEFKSLGESKALKVDKIQLRIKLLSLLARKLSIGFVLSSKAVKLKGNISNGILGRDVSEFYVNFRRLKLDTLFTPGYLNDVIIKGRQGRSSRRNSPLSLLSGFSLRGELDGEVEVLGDKKSVQSFDLSLLDVEMAIEGRKLSALGLVPGGLDIGKLDASFISEKGKAKVNELTLAGKDIKLEARGALRFEKAPKKGNINLELNLVVPPSAKKNLAGSLNLVLVPLGAELKEGRAAFRISGPLGGRSVPRVLPLN